jgi:hypothetical protein
VARDGPGAGGKRTGRSSVAAGTGNETNWRIAIDASIAAKRSAKADCGIAARRRAAADSGSSASAGQGDR